MTSPFYVVYRQKLDADEQSALAAEVWEAHRQNEGPVENLVDGIDHDSASRKINLGVTTGGNLADVLPVSVGLARRALAWARHDRPKARQLANLVTDEPPLTGLALLYGPAARMNAHYDSPTQPGQREEWLVLMTVGLPVLFRLNKSVERLLSGDVLVMDSMATLHGVEEILSDDSGLDFTALGLQVPARLGVLLWEGRQESATRCRNDNQRSIDDAMVEGIQSLFGAEDEDSE